MKVLHITPSVPKVRGGTSQAVLDMVKALRANGVDAVIATTNDNGDDLLDVPLQRCIEYQEVPVWFFQRFSPTVKAVREFAFSWQLTVWLWQNICQYDIVHVHAIFSYASTIAMAIARLKKVPYIVMPHGLLCTWSLQQRARKKQIYLNLIEKANLNHSQALHFTTEQEQNEASPLTIQSSGFVVPLGISQPKLIPDASAQIRHHFKLPEDELIILFLSRLHPKKGLDYLIPALGKLIHYRFTFVLAGSGALEYENEVKSLLIANGLQGRSHFAGFVDGEFKDALIQGSDLFALTSHSENFAVAVLEALAVGIPALVTPGVALSSIIQQHHLGYVPALEVTDIQAKLEHYLSCPQDACERGDRARCFIAENYELNGVARKLNKTYTEILNST
jgi:glycosyltransferase involved in cell wall biosynthesis